MSQYLNLNSYIELMRPGNAIMAGVAVFIGALVSGGVHIYKTDTAYIIYMGAMAAFLISSGGNALNDYFDRESDKKNHSNRPLPSGRLTPQAALIFAILCFLLPILIIPFMQVIPALIVISAAVLLLLYETKLKAQGLPGNIVVSLLTGATFLLGAVIAGNWMFGATLGILAFLSNLGREISKDIEDMEGDTDRQTYPQSVGRQKAAFVSGLMFILAAGMSPIPVLLGQFADTGALAYFLSVIPTVLLFLYAAVVSIKQYEGKYSPASSSKLAMLFGLLAFTLGSLFS